MKKEIVVAVVVMSGVLGCSTPEEKQKVEAADLLSEWRLALFYENGEEQAVADSIAPSLTFLADSTVSGFGGCNRFFSRYKLGADAALSLGAVGSTMMACPEEIMRQEHRFFQALERVETFELRDAALKLFYNDRVNYLVFRRHASSKD